MNPDILTIMLHTIRIIFFYFSLFYSSLKQYYFYTTALWILKIHLHKYLNLFNFYVYIYIHWYIDKEICYKHFAKRNICPPYLKFSLIKFWLNKICDNNILVLHWSYASNRFIEEIIYHFCKIQYPLPLSIFCPRSEATKYEFPFPLIYLKII